LMNLKSQMNYDITSLRNNTNMRAMNNVRM